MRILVCAQEAPVPPLNGFRLQLRALLEELGRRHTVRVLAFGRSAEAGAAQVDLRLVAPPPAGSLAKALALPGAIRVGLPLSVRRLTPLMSGPLREELGSFRPDVVHVSPAEMAGLSGELGRAPCVLAALDAWHLNADAEAEAAGGLRSRLLMGEARRIRRFEAGALRAFGAVVVVSEEDRAALLGLDPTLPVRVVRNGVDPEAFSPMPGVPREPDLVVFTGVMDYVPNEDAARFLAAEVMPLVRRVRPAARLALVGRRPSPVVRALGAQPGVEVTGEVGDMREWLSRASAYACPMRSGTGVKNKLLEAMAAGLPCVVTPLALRGSGAGDGREVLVGTSAHELAAALARVLGDPTLASSVGGAAAAYVRRAHDWRTVAGEYERIYVEVAAG